MATFLENEIDTTEKDLTGTTLNVQIMFPLKDKIMQGIIYTLSKNEQNFNVGSKMKKFKISVHGTSNLAILRLQGASKFELVL